MNKYILLMPLLAMLLVSCRQEVEQSIEYALTDIDLELEGPLFPGSNETQAQVNFSPEEVLAKSGLSREQIVNVRVKSVSLKIHFPENFDLFQSLVVQLVGGEAALTSVAMQSPVPAGASEVSLGVAEKAALPELKTAKNLYFVLDANLKEEYEEDITLKGDIVFLLDVSK